LILSDILNVNPVNPSFVTFDLLPDLMHSTL